MGPRTARTTATDKVLPETRVLAAIIVPFLAAAFVMLYLFPEDTDRLFAWPVRPRMTAMMLGATYLGGAYFFIRVILARRWNEVRLGILPVAALAAILGLATALHWDRFTHGHISFQLWVLLYFSLPFVLPAAWFRNDRHHAKPADAEQLPATIRAIFAGLGVVLTVVGLLLLVVPDVMIPTWPWDLTPLTARVISAMFVLTGLVAGGLALDGAWAAARRILEAQALAVVLTLVAIIVARDEFDWSRWVSWLFVGGLVVVLGCVTAAVVRFRGAD